MKRQYKSFDFFLFLLVCIVSIFGIVLIRSATMNADSTAISNLSMLQAVWFGTGLLLLLFAAFLDYNFISRFYIVIYGVNIFLLLLVLVVSKSTSFRWLQIIGERGIQPSEFSKIFTIIFLAKLIDKNQKQLNNILMLGFILLNVVVSFVLIKEQPSLSASLVIIAISLGILFVAKLSYKYILPAMLSILPAAGLIIYDVSRSPNYLFIDKFLDIYQINRILTWLNPDPNDPLYFQTFRSINAIGSGQLVGKGLYSGTLTQMRYVPYSYNDFIYSVLGEEFGFVGSVTLLILMLLIIAKCLLVAHKAVDLNGRLIATGVASMFAFQTFVNVGVVTGLIPNTGMPFPFVSYGGSSLWVCMIGVGLVINVGMTKRKSVFDNN